MVSTRAIGPPLPPFFVNVILAQCQKLALSEAHIHGILSFTWLAALSGRWSSFGGERVKHNQPEDRDNL